MLTQYIHRLLSKAIYTKDESGYILAEIPNYQGFFSQGSNFEEARTNLMDAIEGVITFKLSKGDQKMLSELQTFMQQQAPNYA